MITTNNIFRGFLATALGLTATIGLANSASAQAFSSYNVQHNFRVLFRGNNAPNIALGFDNGFTQAVSLFCNDTDGYNNVFIPPRTDSATAICPSAVANANSNVQANIFGNLLTGSTRAWGSAAVGRQGGSAFATSNAGLVAGQLVRIPNIGFWWSPRFSTGVGGAASAFLPRVRDPISFTVTDTDTGNTLLDGNLLDILAEHNGVVNWDDDSLDFTGVTDGIFRIDMNNPFIENPGTLVAEFRDGILIRSEDTGRFDGWLPDIGSSGTFSITGSNFTSNLEFNAILPDFGRDVNFSLDMNGGGTASVVVPEPSSVMGIMGLVAIGAISTLKRKHKTAKST